MSPSRTGGEPGADGGVHARSCSLHFLYVNGIESVDPRSISDASLLKLTFQARNGRGCEKLAQTIGYVNRARAFMPPGTVAAVHHAL